MFKGKFSFWYIIPVIVFCFISELFAITTIKADNPNFEFNGRIDFSVPDQPVLFWPGSYIRANFEGPLLILMLDDQTGQSYYSVFIDEDYENPRIIDCTAGSQIYLVSASLADTIHSLMFFRRTEASTGSTKFLGIQINDGKTLLAPPARPEHKILFYGNSITCGMGNEAPDNGADDRMAEENNFLAYGAIASRLLDAEYMCVAKSGIGVMISWFNMVMSDYYYRLNPDDPSSNWDFNLYIPDVVVINLFQNDSWLIGNLNPVPDSSQITNAYVDFVREIRIHHPNAFIVCSLGSMDATRIGSPWPGYIQSAVDYIRDVDTDTNIGTFFFPFDLSWTKHPRVRHHLVMGQNLATFISDNMGWVNYVEDDNVTELPNNFSLLQNYPNPFNPSTTIEYLIETPGNVRIIIYDALGREIKTLLNEYKGAGKYKELFNADNLSSGIYYYQLINENNVQTKSMVILK